MGLSLQEGPGGVNMPFVRMRGAIGSQLAYQGLQILLFGMHIDIAQVLHRTVTGCPKVASKRCV